MGDIEENRGISRRDRQARLDPVGVFDDEFRGGNAGALGENALQRGAPSNITRAILGKTIAVCAIVFRRAQNTTRR